MKRHKNDFNWLYMTNISTVALVILLTSIYKKEIYTDWTEYNGGADKNHFSSLIQINPSNVNSLKIAWEYQSGGADSIKNATQMQCNPLIIKGILYGVSAASQAFAVDAATGK